MLTPVSLGFCQSFNSWAEQSIGAQTHRADSTNRGDVFIGGERECGTGEGQRLQDREYTPLISQKESWLARQFALKQVNRLLIQTPLSPLIKDSYWRWPQRDLVGDAIDFLMRVLGLSFHDAMRQITSL